MNIYTIALAVSGLTMLCVILFTKADENNQVSNLSAIAFYISFIVFVVAMVHSWVEL